MALQKQPIEIPFGSGLDTKTNPAQVQLGKFLELNNVVFNNGALQKRNGMALLSTLPDTASTTLTTLNGNLLATGTQMRAYSEETDQWIEQGLVQPVDLTTMATVRTAVSQVVCDSVTSSTGLTMTAYAEGSTYYYQITDKSTGQLILPRTAIGSTATTARCFVLGNYFILSFMQTVTATPTFRYIAVPLTAPTVPLAVADISTNVAAITTGYDGVVANNRLYFVFGGSSTTVKMVYMDELLNVSTEASYASSTADLATIAVDTDTVNPTVYAAFWDTTSDDAFMVARSETLGAALLAKTQVLTNVDVVAMTLVAKNGTGTLTYQVSNTVVALGSVRMDYVNQVTCDLAATVGTPTVLKRGVGLASKAFEGPEDEHYVLLSYGGTLQPTYFLSDFSGNILMKLAYSNGAGYASTQLLPSVSSVNGLYSLSYLTKTLLSSINKTTGSTVVAGIYAQTGVNEATFSINNSGQQSAEVANALHLTGGYIFEYDGVLPVEHGFAVWPEDVTASTSTSGGSLTDQTYNYVFCYEWTDGAGKLHRSAPSVPESIVTTGGNTSTNTIVVPTLKLTAKVGSSKVRVVGYRWSTANQTYYQFTSQSSPTINDPTTDTVTFTDTAADSTIIGNNILYTTGGVLENIAAPASSGTTLFKNRLFTINAESRNELWYSKPVLAATPVEFSDLQTIYVAPSIGTQGSTGAITAIAGLDDKLIIFKDSAIYYVTGTGPDITGANNDFSDPVFITAAVGCTVPSSVVLMPTGLMFQSNKGIWLLGRDLSTQYIGADVEQYNSARVVSAVTVPGTNQVRFCMDSNITLMYDYYYGQWSTFTGFRAISSVIYDARHTTLNSLGQVQKENTGYLDISSPVLISFRTAWIKMVAIQGYQRAYFAYLLGTYLSPHRLQVSFAYDYDPSTVQTTQLRPLNQDDAWGTEQLWGSGSPWGGGSNTEQYRVFMQQQRCQAVQMVLQENFAASDGTAGAGLSLTSLNFIIGAKAGMPKLSARQSGG